jgi:hypothetical protein
MVNIYSPNDGVELSMIRGLINVNYYSRSTTIIIPVLSTVAETEGARRATDASATERTSTRAAA